MLARLGLESGEEDYYAEQLSAILEHIDRLREVDTDAIPPTAQVVPLQMRLREDEPQPGLSQEQALANAPEARDGLFVVKAILEAEP
jgi:aspartyl-tRNA(Asn)/glutamyl-tRNA(Gln) amidotransferase subunit C